MHTLISSSCTDSAIYISNIMASSTVAGISETERSCLLLCFDSSTYLHKVARHIGHISQLAFHSLPGEGYVEVRSAPVIGAISHLPSNILDIRTYTDTLAENNGNIPAVRQAIEDLYRSNGYAVGLDITLKSYQINQYAVINQAVARMGGLFFGYASICLETAQKLYQVGEINQSIDLLKHLRSEAATLQEVFANPREVNTYLPAPIPFAELAAIGVCTGIGLFVTLNLGKFAPMIGIV
jgi:hypothetical protein